MTFRSLMRPAKANELFAKLSETSDGAVKTRERLFAELKADLEFHTSLEEQHLFPVLRRNPETKDLVADAIRDNKELRAKVAELDGMAKNDAIFSERLSELQKVFRQHARDRKELLPAVQLALSEEQVQGVTDKMEAGIAGAEQAKQDEAEERRAKARQEREEAEFLARVLRPFGQPANFGARIVCFHCYRSTHDKPPSACQVELFRERSGEIVESLNQRIGINPPSAP